MPSKKIAFPVLVLLALFSCLPNITSAQGHIVEKGIIILVKFPDVNNVIDRNLVEMRFSRQLNNYVRQMSYDKVSLEIDTTEKWYTLPEPVGHYKISPRNLEVDRSRVRKLIDDTFGAVENDVNFSKYDFSVIFMNAKAEDYGMIGLCGYPGMLGFSSQDALKTPSGQLIKGGTAIFCFQAHLGTLFHDIAHILGGTKEGKRMLPCLYDHDLQAKPGPTRQVGIEAMINMGYWDPMSCHFYKWGQPPPGVCSWTKIRLNWLEPSQIKIINPVPKTEFVLDPLENGSAQILAAKIPISKNTYYLLENRQPIGCDKVLPQYGVLVMYADDSVAECRHGLAPVKLINANPSVPNLEAAAFDIDGKNFYQDNKNGIRIDILEKIGDSYKIRVNRSAKHPY